MPQSAHTLAPSRNPRSRTSATRACRAAPARTLSALTLALCLSGCASGLSAEQRPAQLLTDKPLPRPEQVVGLREPQGGVRGIERIRTPRIRPLAVLPPATQALPPQALVEPLDLYNRSAQEALMLALRPGGLGYAFAGGFDPTRTATVRGLRGDLPKVLDALGELYGFFWSYRHGTVFIEAERQFSVSLPPIKGLAESVAKALTERDAQAVSVDSASGQLSYKANAQVAHAAEGYLENLLNQPLLSLELTVLEVRLSKGQQIGIDWSKASFLHGGDSVNFKGPAASLAGAGSAAVNWAFGSKFSMDVLLQFLAKHGQTEIVSQPRLQMLSNGKTDLHIGNTVRFISKIGTSQVGTTGVAQTTAETEELNTGLKLSVSAAYQSGMVATTLALELSELLGYDTNQIGKDQLLRLPQSSDRKLSENTLRLRPGEPGLLFGLINKRSSKSREGLSNAPVLDLLTTSRFDENAERSELVVVLTPTVIEFVDEDAPEAPQPPAPAKSTPAPLLKPARVELLEPSGRIVRSHYETEPQEKGESAQERTHEMAGKRTSSAEGSTKKDPR